MVFGGKVSWMVFGGKISWMVFGGKVSWMVFGGNVSWIIFGGKVSWMVFGFYAQFKIITIQSNSRLPFPTEIVLLVSICKFGLSVWVFVCLFVCLYPINVKTAEPIGPKFFVGHLGTPGKVYE